VTKRPTTIEYREKAGIGTSAGGLEALAQFFGNMPENSGLAYVVIKNLDPNHVYV